MPNRVVLLHSDILINRGVVAAALSEAWSIVLEAQHGNRAAVWKQAYEEIAADWESYWADLDVGGDDSLNQWREGRWRIVRGWFRLAGEGLPENEQIPYFLDGLVELVGAQAVKVSSLVWRAGAVDALDALADARQMVAIVDPYAPAAMVRGMLVACRTVVDRGVIGPDELGQVGLEGIEWNTLAHLAEANPATMRFVTPHLMRGGLVIEPPANLADLPSLVKQDGNLRN